MTIDYATCTACNRAFTRKSDKQWKRLCLSCWKASRAKQESAANGEQAVIKALTQYCKRLENELEVLRGQPRLGHPPAHVLRFLMKVAHPDRNDGSEAANEAMRWILGARKEVCHAEF